MTDQKVNCWETGQRGPKTLVLSFLDEEDKKTSLYVNPEFTVETVRMMISQKANLQEDILVLVIRRSEVAFRAAMTIFPPHCDFRPLFDHARIKNLPCLDDVNIRTIIVTPAEISIEVKFTDGKITRVTIDRCAPTGRLVNKVCSSLHFSLPIALTYFGQELDDLSLPLYKYGIVFSVTLEGRFIGPTAERRIYIKDMDIASKSCYVNVQETITVKNLEEKIKQATRDFQPLVIIWNDQEMTNSRFVIKVKSTDTFMKKNVPT